jgi:tetratricopeptide (TPR) repeat protein
MRASLKFLLLPALVILVCRTPAAADDRSDCVNAYGDLKIATCSRVIAGGGNKLSWAYNNRANAFRERGDLDRAMSDYNEAIRLDPRNSFPHNGRGNVYYDRKDYDRALSDYSDAIRFDPRYARAYVGRGNVYKEKGDLDRALADYNEAIRLDPENAFAFNGRGNVYKLKGDLDRALSDYNDAIRLNPKASFPYNGRGNVHYDKKEYELALSDYNEAIRIDSKNSNAFNGRGNVHYERKEYDQALADYNDAIGSDPKNAFAYNGRGNIYKEKGDLDRAMSDYNEAIRLDPKSVRARTGRGLIYYNRKDYDQALSEYNEAIRIDQKYTWAYNNRGLVYLNRKDYDRALSDFSDAIRIDPNNAKASANRGLAYKGLGDFDRARADLNEALRLDPSLAYARDAVASLKTASPAVAAPAPVSPVSKPVASASTQRRVALIISNSNYVSPGIAQLPNPKNDAELIASVLRSIGFQSVELKSDLSREQMIKALQDFASQADNSDWSVFYYSGHGIAYNGSNYMIPVDARLKADRDIDLEAIDAGKISNSMTGSRQLRLVVLDMCRNNPFIRQMTRSVASRGIGRGLAPPAETTAGEFTAFAARDGQEALDGDGRNSPFAEALAKRLQMPNVDIRRVFDWVRDDVLKVTNGMQQPFTYGSLPPVDYYFVKN